MTEPDFDQIAQVEELRKYFIDDGFAREASQNQLLTEALRQVWNARGVADIAKVNESLVTGNVPKLTDAIKALDLLPCKCGCGKIVAGGRLETAHPDDYRSERG